MAKPYLQHLKSGKSLETTYEAVRAGFVALALEKNRRATPFVAQARALKAASGRAKTPADLLNCRRMTPTWNYRYAASVGMQEKDHERSSTTLPFRCSKTMWIFRYSTVLPKT